MKKTLLSMTAALAVIGAANAGIKETCLEHPDKLVWVEKTQRCVPINPCLSDDISIKDSYCNTIFDGNDLREDLVEMVLDRYLSKVMLTKGKEYNINTDSNFVAVKTADDSYVVFDFRDISIKYGAGGAGAASLFRVACKSSGFGDTLATGGSGVGPCKYSFMCILPTQRECHELSDFYEQLSKLSPEETYWDGKYCNVVVDTAMMRHEDGRCMDGF